MDKKGLGLSLFHNNVNERKIGMISDVYEQLKQHTPYRDIKDYLFERKKLLTEEQFSIIFRLALDRYKEDVISPKPFYIQQSIYRYENEIKRLVDEQDPELIHSYHNMCLDTMKDLEVLVGLQTERVRMEVTSTIKSRENKLDNLDDLNLSKLTFEERLDFLRLLEKSKFSDLEMESIKLGGSKKVEELVNTETTDKKDYVQFEEIETFEIIEEEPVKQFPLEEIVKKVQISHINPTEERENENSNE